MMRIAVVAILAALVASLVGCGVKRDLRPPTGTALPPAPYGRSDPPTAGELLRPRDQAMLPVRGDELRIRSEERAGDPFDLPPH